MPDISGLPSDVFIQIFHPGTGGESEVPASSLPAWYAAGWRLLGDGDLATEPDAGDPPPISRKDAAAAKAKLAAGPDSSAGADAGADGKDK